MGRTIGQAVSHGIARRRAVACLSDDVVRVLVRRLLLGAVRTGGGGGPHPGRELGLGTSKGAAGGHGT